MSEKIVMSNLPKTWILDLDGTLVKHNGYKEDGHDTLLDSANTVLKNIKEDDLVVIITSRKKKYKKLTENFLQEHKIRFDVIVYEAPYGERIVVNDNKDTGLRMAYSFGGPRNDVNVPIRIDESL